MVRDRALSKGAIMSLHLASVSAALIVTALGLSLLTSAAHMPGQMSSVRAVPALAISPTG